jgi:ABC-type nickel/cobalt efflux system permease component RcnA
MRTVQLIFGTAALAAILSAHPMGNFSVNHYSKIELEPAGASVLFVIDLAEIPAFELLQKWGLTAASPKEELQRKALAEAREWGTELYVRSDRKPVAMMLTGAEVATDAGAGGLPVMRIVSHWKVACAPGRFEYSDGTYPDRTAGWKEIVATAAGGAGIKTSTVGGKDLSAGLTAYPQDATIAPPQVLKADILWVGTPVAVPVVSEEKPAPVAVVTAPTVAAPASMGQVKRNDFLSRALKGGEIGWGLGLVCMAVAFWFGALHALEPGHGKTMVAAYLVGSKGTMKHALFLGGMVTFTHTISVFFLGLVTLFLSQYIMPDKISKVLGVVSGLTILYLGGWLLYKRTVGLSDGGHGHHHHHHHDDFEDDHGLAFSDHKHHHHSYGGHTHTHDGHTHSHVPEGDVTFKSLAALGASGGLVPCPSALVLLLSAISIGRTGFGLLLLISFSLGLALVLMAMGLLVVYAKNLLPRNESDEPGLFFRYMPVVSAAIIFAIGVVLTGNALGVIPVMRFFS